MRHLQAQSFPMQPDSDCLASGTGTHYVLEAFNRRSLYNADSLPFPPDVRFAEYHVPLGIDRYRDELAYRLVSSPR